MFTTPHLNEDVALVDLVSGDVARVMERVDTYQTSDWHDGRIGGRDLGMTVGATGAEGMSRGCLIKAPKPRSLGCGTSSIATMGFMDGLRNTAEQFQAQQQGRAEQTLAAALPDGVVAPRRVQVPLHPGFADATLQAFLATAQIAPEDCYGITCIQSNDVTIGWELYFRHQPDYDAGLARWAAVSDR